MSAKKEEIAARVREMRECREMSATVLAEAVGVSAEDYRKMESAETDFPASVLYEISLVLKADLAELLTGRPAHLHIYTVTRKGQGVKVCRRKDYGYENLASGFTHKKCEPFLVYLEAEHGMPAGNTHPGQEFNYVLEGRVRLRIHDQDLTLDAGDSVYFDAAYPHAMEALDGKPARFLAVIL